MALYCCNDPLIGSQFRVDAPLHSIGTTLPPAPPSVAPENNLTTKTPPNYTPTPTPFPRLIMAGIYIRRS